MKKKKEEKKIIKSNMLVESRYKLSLQEMKLLLWLVNSIDINDKEWHTYKLWIKDFIDITDIKRPSIYKEAKKITKKFLKKVVEIQEGKVLLQTHFMASVSYIDGEGYILYDFHPKLKKHLLRLQEAFMSYNIENVIHMKSVFSIRIYELIASYKGLGKRTIELEELKYMLMIEDKYKQWNDFKRYVLEISKRDCLKYSDLYFDYETHKRGRKIYAITFNIKQKKQMKLFASEDYIKNTDIATIDPKIKELEAFDEDAVPAPKEIKERLK
jgi:plasmid replication initiation protein